MSAVLLFAILMITAAGGLAYAVYFSGHNRRRMPRWLVVVVLMLFLAMPRIDVAYTEALKARKAAQAAEG